MKNKKCIEYVVYITTTIKNDKEAGEPGFYNGTNYDALYKFEFKINSGVELTVINEALVYFYENFWTNSTNNTDLFEQELDKFKKGLDKLQSETYYNVFPDKYEIIKNFESELRQQLSCDDKTVDEFKRLSVDNKINYLSDLGCNLDYFVVPKKFVNSFETIEIEN